MGNKTSIESSGYKEHENLKKHVNKIASKYILTQTFQDMKNLAEHVESSKDGTGDKALTNGCSKLTIFTEDLLDQYLNNRDVAYLFQETHKNENVNIIKEDKLMYIHDDTIKNIKKKKSTLTKKRMCNGIAKYYIDIASIFAAIASSVDINTSGSKILSSSDVAKKMDMLGHDTNDSDKKKDDINRANEYTNYCSRRIKSIENLIIHDKDRGVSNKETIQISNSYKQVKENFLKYNDGLSELDALYYDQYSLKNGKYTSMSPKQRKKYTDDVKLMYSLFYKNNKQPISFDNMEFKDIIIPEKNIGNTNKSTNVTINKNNKHFIKFYEAIVAYYNEMKAFKQKLLKNVVFKLFVIRETREGREEITINPSLTNDGLGRLKEETMTILFDMYMQCEKKYQLILDYYETLLIKIGVDTSYARELEKDEIKAGVDKFIRDKSEPSIEEMKKYEEKESEEKKTVKSCKDYYKFQHPEYDNNYSGFYAIQNALQYDYLKYDELDNNDIWTEDSHHKVNLYELLDDTFTVETYINSHDKDSNKAKTLIEELNLNEINRFKDLVNVKSIDERMIIFLLKQNPKLYILSFEKYSSNNDIMKFIQEENYGFGMIIKLEETEKGTSDYIALLRINKEDELCKKYKYIIFDSRKKEKLLLKNNEIDLIYISVDKHMARYDLSSFDGEQIKKYKSYCEKLHRRLNGKKFLVLRNKKDIDIEEPAGSEAAAKPLVPEAAKSETLVVPEAKPLVPEAKPPAAAKPVVPSSPGIPVVPAEKPVVEPAGAAAAKPVVPAAAKPVVPSSSGIPVKLEEAKPAKLEAPAAAKPA